MNSPRVGSHIDSQVRQLGSSYEYLNRADISGERNLQFTYGSADVEPCDWHIYAFTVTFGPYLNLDLYLTVIGARAVDRSRALPHLSPR